MIELLTIYFLSGPIIACLIGTAAFLFWVATSIHGLSNTKNPIYGLMIIFASPVLAPLAILLLILLLVVCFIKLLWEEL